VASVFWPYHQPAKQVKRSSTFVVTPELCVIIVNWNGGDLLRRCVKSIIAAGPQRPYEIVVIDNASSDDSLSLLRNDPDCVSYIQDQRLRIIENSDNRGFGPANNQGFAATNAPLLFLLNPDTEVSAGAIDTLIATVNSDEGIGACGPRILNTDGSVQVSAWRNPPAPWEILLSQLKLYRLLPSRLRGELLLGGHWQHDRRREVPMLSGAALLVKREVIDQVGGFDETFHMYGEDNEWCFRMVRAGWRLMFEPDAVVLHHGAQSSLQRWNSLQKLQVQMEASFRFQKQSVSRLRLIGNQLAGYITSSGQDISRSVRGIDAPEVTAARKIHWQLFKRALRNTEE
jgi:GT2 family glycosyltransferase